MILLKQTDEYRADSETEAKELMEKFREMAHEQNFVIKKITYNRKEKKSKGEIIDEGYLVVVQKVFSEFFNYS